MSKLTGKELAQFALSKLGTPYVYGAKGALGNLSQSWLNVLIRSYPGIYTPSYITKSKKYVGKVATDCSGLISWYTGKNLSSSMMKSTASYVGSIKDIHKAPVGAVLWRQGHVGVYIGQGQCVEARGINYGVVRSKVSKRDFTHYLLFDYIDYDNKSQVETVNKYSKPTVTLRKGSRGEGVKWVQDKLKVAVDGIYGSDTEKAVKKFQEKNKLTIDGICGPATRAALYKVV